MTRAIILALATACAPPAAPAAAADAGAPGFSLHREPDLHLLVQHDEHAHLTCATNVDVTSGTFSAPYCLPDVELTQPMPLGEAAKLNPAPAPAGGKL